MKLVGVEESTHEALKKYCKKNGLTMGEFVTHALAYFMSSGISPTSPPQSVKEELTKIEKRVSQGIAFQKTFERDRLNPLLSDLAEAVVAIKKKGDSVTKAEVISTVNQLFIAIQEKTYKPQMNEIKNLERVNSIEASEVKKRLDDIDEKISELINRKGLFGR